jgi:hypothetical protein
MNLTSPSLLQALAEKEIIIFPIEKEKKYCSLVASLLTF